MNSSHVERTETDVLVIGTGAAGLFAALRAAGERRRVTMITKSGLSTSSSAWAQGGIAAAVSSDDSPELHFVDTLAAGRGLCNEAAARILTHEGPACIRALGQLGLEFDRGPNGFELGLEGGHSRRRILHVGGSATGAALVRALAARVAENDRIRVCEFTAAMQLLSDGERCSGALAYDSRDQAPKLFHAAATILATGGAAGLYWRTTNPPSAAGEGFALAYEAGSELMDMEFVQFHPTALWSPRGRAVLISEAVRGEGAQLVDHAGRRFMPAYHSLGELAPRDVVASAIWQEMARAGTEHVWLRLEHLGPAFIKQRFANIYEACLAEGVDITRDRVPVAPAAHFSIGGVRTDLDGRTSLGALWACGEVAATGVHGANRLASNSLLECLVFAQRVAESAARSEVRETPFPESVLASEPEWDAHRVDTTALGRLLTERVGLVRCGPELREVCQQIEQWWPQYAGHAADWRNRLTVARLITQAALLRTESRGAHVRSDYPSDDAQWLGHVVLKKGTEPRCIGL